MHQALDNYFPQSLRVSYLSTDNRTGPLSAWLVPLARHLPSRTRLVTPSERDAEATSWLVALCESLSVVMSSHRKNKMGQRMRVQPIVSFPSERHGHEVQPCHMGSWREAEESQDCCQSRAMLITSAVQQNPAFTTASRDRQRSAPATKAATGTCPKRNQAELYSWNTGLNNNPGPPSKFTQEGALSLCYQPNTSISQRPFWPPLLFNV